MKPRLAVIGLLVFALLAAAGATPATEPAESVGVVDPVTGGWFLRDPASGETTSFFYGNPGDTPMMGDSDCDGVDTPGLYRRSDGYVYLRNSNAQGVVGDIRFFFGNPADVPLAGDFDGNGCDTVSVYRPSQSWVYVINELGDGDAGLGAAEVDYVFGNPGDEPFVGDFDGDGTDTIGLYRPATGLVYFRNSHTQGTASDEFVYGNPGDRIIAGAWSGAGGPGTVGIFRGGAFHLRHTNTPGAADEHIGYGNGAMVPVTGNFGALPGGDPPPELGLAILPRWAWGAEPADLSKMNTHTVQFLTVHHAGPQSSTTGPPRFRSWQDLHTGRGWGDIAYHYIIGIDGTVWEGRDIAYEPDSGTDYDTTGHLGVVVEGNFDIDQPTQEQLDSLVRLLAWASLTYDVSPATITGHKDHAATACPGGNLYPYIHSGDLQRDVEDLLSG